MNNSDVDQVFPGGWVRAVLPAAILSCLEHSSLHGYGIAKKLEQRGLGSLKGGSLYPVLNKLELSGDVTTIWVEGSFGPARREYTLTPAGRARLVREEDQWHRLLAASFGVTVKTKEGSGDGGS